MEFYERAAFYNKQMERHMKATIRHAFLHAYHVAMVKVFANLSDWAESAKAGEGSRDAIDEAVEDFKESMSAVMPKDFVMPGEEEPEK